MDPRVIKTRVNALGGASIFAINDRQDFDIDFSALKHSDVLMTVC